MTAATVVLPRLLFGAVGLFAAATALWWAERRLHAAEPAQANAAPATAPPSFDAAAFLGHYRASQADADWRERTRERLRNAAAGQVQWAYSLARAQAAACAGDLCDAGSTTSRTWLAARDWWADGTAQSRAYVHAALARHLALDARLAQAQAGLANRWQAALLIALDERGTALDATLPSAARCAAELRLRVVDALALRLEAGSTALVWNSLGTITAAGVGAGLGTAGTLALAGAGCSAKTCGVSLAVGAIAAAIAWWWERDASAATLERELVTALDAQCAMHTQQALLAADDLFDHLDRVWCARADALLLAKAEDLCTR